MGAGQSRNLFQAAKRNELEIARYFMDQNKEDINVRDEDGWTPLHAAGYAGSLEVARELLSCGADPKPTDKGGHTPLHFAALQGHVEVMRALAACAGVDVNAADGLGMAPLHHAAVAGHAAACAELLPRGARVDPKLRNGATPLHLAALKGKLEVVKLLVDRGANYRMVLSDGHTVLHEAAQGGAKDAARYLLSIGANAQAQDENGDTPADVAAKAGHAHVAVLIAAHADARGPPTPQQPQPPVFYSCEQLQGSASGGATPSAPPMPATPPPGDYGAGSNAAQPPASERDFWNRALQTPVEQPGKGGQVSYPEVYKSAAHASVAPATDKPNIVSHQINPTMGTVQGAGESDWWAANVGQDLSDRFPPPKQPAPEQAHPRKQFEDNILRQAQGVWRMLQGKPRDERGAAEQAAHEAARKRAEDAEADAEWGGAGGAQRGWDGGPEGGVPRTEKYDTAPYEPEDDDEYRPHAPKEARAQGGAQAGVRQRLAQLEAQMNNEQGWVRGGTKAEAKVAAHQKERLAEQERQIGALRQQLQALETAAASRAAAGGRGRRQMDGSVPAEYICPITQEVMQEPVVAADGFSYERSAILQWLQMGHTTSPMTNAPLQHPGLTSNRGLRAAIQQWQSQ